MNSAPAKSKSQRAYQWLRDRIRTRDFEPGHRLVLSTIATKLGVSVVPVREAIRQLEAEGLVTYEANVGARVTTLNREVYYQTMETIAVLEGAATALSLPYLGEDDLDTAQAINSRMRHLVEELDPVEFTRLNREFHRSLFTKCPNTRLVELLYDEWDRFEYFRVYTFNYVPNRAPESVKEHDQILQLIRAEAEPSYVEKVARNHRLTTLERYRELTTDLAPQTQTNILFNSK